MTITNKKVKKIKGWFERWHSKHKKNLPDMLVTLTDEAGHTTSLTFEKTKDRNGFVFVRLLSIGYDEGEEIILKETNAQYKWRVNRKEEYQSFAASLRVGDAKVESRYLPKKNETWIMEKPEDLADNDQDEENDRSERNERDEKDGSDEKTSEDRPIKTKLPEMVIPYLESRTGDIVIKY